MTDGVKCYTGGCLCGALRYEATGAPLFAGHCYCTDCRRASGSGFIPFIGFAVGDVRFTGHTRQFRRTAASGREYVRNFCNVCGSMVFGGDAAIDEWYNIYAGSLDDPASFHPEIAIYTSSRPAWVEVLPGLTRFEKLPA